MKEYRSVPVRPIVQPPPLLNGSNANPNSHDDVPSLDVPRANLREGSHEGESTSIVRPSSAQRSATPQQRQGTPRRASTPTRQSTPTRHGATPRPSTPSRPKVIVNLENFEEVAFPISTVFNSPRSLGVCAEYGVHATELLPRPPQEFLAPNVPETIAAMRYHHYETRRQAKLQQLRAARLARIDEEHQSGRPTHTDPYAAPVVATAPRAATPRGRGTPSAAGGDGAGGAVRQAIEEQQQRAVLERDARRQVIYERAAKAKLEREREVIQKQLLAEERLAAHRHALEEEKLRVIEMRRLRWTDARERVEHRRRQQEHSMNQRANEFNAKPERPHSKYQMLLAKELYFTPQQRTAKSRSASAQPPSEP